MSDVRARLENAADLDELRKRAVAQQGDISQRVRVCLSTGCKAKGADKVFERLRDKAKANGDESKVVGVKCTGCHGFCERGPLVIVDPGNIFYPDVTEGDVSEIWQESVMAGRAVERLSYRDDVTGESRATPEDIPFYREQTRIVLSNNGVIDPTKIEEYIAVGGYGGLAKALGSMKPR